ncbi:phage tail protein, partial [Escherichia coli]
VNKAANALPSDGTAVAANRLANAHTINGVAFDGTQDITITSGMTEATADARYVQNVRLGSETSVLMPFGGKVGTGGCVITALSIAGEVDNSGDFAYFRPLQININGSWITVSQL